MKGTQEYKKNFNNRLQRVYRMNRNYPLLEGYGNYIASSLSETTIFMYVSYVAKFLNFTQKSDEHLGLNDYTKYMNSIKEKTQSYQITVYSALKKYSKYLKACEVNKKDPMQFVNRPKFFETEETIKKRDTSYLTQDEIKSYLDAVINDTGIRIAGMYHDKWDLWKPRNILIIMIFLNFGVRCAALYKLDVSSIDIENKKITFSDKGNKTYSCIMSDQIVEVAKKWLENRKIILGDIKEDALFITNHKCRISIMTVRNIVKKYEKVLDKEYGMSPHKLRATFGTQLYSATKDIVFVQQCMHHSSTKVTELYIRGKKEGNQEKALEIMQGLTNLDD